jgi:hypothetical protein
VTILLPLSLAVPPGENDEGIETSFVVSNAAHAIHFQLGFVRVDAYFDPDDFLCFSDVGILRAEAVHTPLIRYKT